MFLLVLSIISLIAAAGFAVLAWHVVREDRLRSNARVAALASTSFDDEATSVAPDIANGAETISAFNRTAEERAPSLLEGQRPEAMRGHPLVKVAVGFAMSVALIVFIAMSGERHDARPAPAAPAAPAPLAAAPQEGTLELLSMRNERNGDTLSVTGLVRNAGAAPAKGLIAVVFAFDRGGNFVASGRAPIDFVTLASGDESPFRVTIPHVTDVGRYRVSFRTESGVVRHVDKRASLQAATR